MVEKRTFELSAEDIAFIEAEVAAGKFAEPSEVIRAAIETRRQDEAEIDRWVKEEVMPTYELWKAGKMKTYTAEEVRQMTEERIRKAEARKKAS